MTFVDEVTEQVVGALQVRNLIKPRSARGRELASSPRSYGVEDGDLWRREIDELESVDRWWQPSVSDEVAPALEQLPDLNRPVLSLEAGQTLDEVALFEVKRFLYWSHVISIASAEAPNLVDPTWLKRIAELMQTIHPERTPSPRYFLASQLDPRLGPARDEIKSVRKAERALRKELEAEVISEHGGKFDVSGRYISPSGPVEFTQETRLRRVDSNRLELADARLEALQTALAEANDRAWTIEAEVRSTISDSLRSELEWLLEMREALARLDERIARVELRRQWNGCWGDWSGDVALTITGGRHPRLQNAVGADEVQPISIRLDDRATVVTGPNMGGKSLLLGLIGLCQWCAQHAFPLPAQSVTFRPVASIVYVGAEESGGEKGAGLSAFGREVRRVVDALDQPAPRLWLLDEFGRGTHPDEGASIARDLIRSRTNDGDRVVAATHFPALAAMDDVAHFRIAGISHPEALQALTESPGALDEIESALRSAMDYRPLVVEARAHGVPRDARLVARALGLDVEDQ